MRRPVPAIWVFFFQTTATPEIYTLSLHDALPISGKPGSSGRAGTGRSAARWRPPSGPGWKEVSSRSEEHTSELQSRRDLVCRLLLEKKKRTKSTSPHKRDDEGHKQNKRRKRRQYE